MVSDFTDQEKLEVVEHMIEQWRVARSSAGGDRDVYLILKEIARDIRGRMPNAPGRTRERLQRAIDNAKSLKVETGYRVRDLRSIAEIAIGEWSTIRQALDKFEGNISK